MIRILAPSLLALALSACHSGGGSPSPSPTPTPQPVPTRTAAVLWGYFGAVENPRDMTRAPAAGQASSVQETAPHSTLVMTGSWGNPYTPAGRQALAELAIKHMQQAKAAGVDRFVLWIDYILFGGGTAYRGKDAAMPEVEALLARCDAEGLLDDLAALYVLDEPNVNVMAGFDDACRDLRALLNRSGPLSRISLFSIYGPLRLGAPGIALLDWVGLDDYDRGVGVLDDIDRQLRPMLRGGQRIVIVPGGTSPWCQDPGPFIEYAAAHDDVVLVMPFTWFSSPGGAGIGDNVTRAAYIAAGTALRAGRDA